MITRDNAKHLAAIVTACAGLATAVKSCTDSQAQAELVATRKVYAVVAERIAKQDEQIRKLHDDDVELRAYVQGFKEAVQQQRSGSGAPAPASPALGFRGASAPSPLVPMRRPPHTARAPASDEAMPDAVRVLPPPPAPKAAPSFEQLPSFEGL